MRLKINAVLLFIQGIVITMLGVIAKEYYINLTFGIIGGLIMGIAVLILIFNKLLTK